MFLNAHCHLELSYLRGKIPPGLPFVEWLGHLFKLRRETPLEEQRQAAREAVKELKNSSTSVVFDIQSSALSEAPLRQSSLGCLYFHEIIRFDPRLGPETVNLALAKQHQHGPLPANQHHGLSPHAPYTVTEPLLRSAKSASLTHNQWLCIHAAETTEETEFVEKGSGDLRDWLDPFLPPKWTAPAMRPLAWLDTCDCLTEKTLLVHCNDLNESDIQLIKARKCSVVVCPGSHVYFHRREFPLKKLYDNGIPVYIGTDSLASNESLDMEREIKLAKELSGLSLATIQKIAAAERAQSFLE
jgi:aminodeoxyfutalosine deaminase